jgi:pyruvate ferredoxin oxidoreductase gamma subunit
MAKVATTTTGLRDKGYFICNYDGGPEGLRADLKLGSSVKVSAVDATGIALKCIGKDFPNTPMVGALLKATGIVKFDSMVSVMGEKFKGPVRAANEQALKMGYDGGANS